MLLIQPNKHYTTSYIYVQITHTSKKSFDETWW